VIGDWPAYMHVGAALSERREPAPARSDESSPGAVAQRREAAVLRIVRRFDVHVVDDRGMRLASTWLRLTGVGRFRFPDPDGVVRRARLVGGGGGVEWSRRRAGGWTASVEVEGWPEAAA